MPELHFCYGTLMPMARERGGHPARIYGRLWHNGSYPAAVRGEPGGPMVAGIVLEVTVDDLEQLDAYEGVGHGWYRRVRVRMLGGEDVWVYEGAGCLCPGLGMAWRIVAPTSGYAMAWPVAACR